MIEKVIKNKKSGFVPVGWKSLKIGDFLSLEYGKALKETDRNNGNVFVYGSNGLIGFHNKRLVEGPGVIVGRKGSAGEVTYCDRDFYPIDTAYFVKTDLNIKFVYYLLKSVDFKKIVGSSAVPGLNRNDVYSQKIKIPIEENEQDRIAEILSFLDDKIELNRKINSNLEKIASLLFKQWFIDVGNSLPSGWSVGRVSDFAKVKSGFAFKGEDFKNVGVPVIKIKNVIDPEISFKNIDYISEGIVEEKAQDFILKSKDILIAMSGNTTGKIGIMPKTKNYYVLNQRVGKYFLKNEKNLGYLYFYLRSGDVQKNIIQSAYGSAQPNISPSILENMKILIPQKEVLDNFNKISNEIIDIISNNNFENDILSGLRDSLLPKLMSGKIRVN